MGHQTKTDAPGDVRAVLDALAPTRELLTVSEAARILGLSRSTAYRACETGELPSLVIGGCRRVSIRGLRELVIAVAAVDTSNEAARRRVRPTD